MALIKCPECGKEISDKAPHCIHCGFPMENISKEHKSETKKQQTNTADYKKTETGKADSYNTVNKRKLEKKDALLSLDYNLNNLYYEMLESYYAMVDSDKVTETIAKQNLVTMREFLENLIAVLIRDNGISEEQILAAVQIKTGKKENINPKDIFAGIIALAYFGIIPANIEKVMHRVRNAGNDAAHYSAVDNGKPNMLRGKTPEEMRNIGSATMSDIDDIVDFLKNDYKPVNKPKTASGKNLKMMNIGKPKKKNGKGLGILLIILVLAVLGVFLYQQVSKENEEKAKVNAKTAAIATLKTPTKEQIAYSAKFASIKNFNPDAIKEKIRGMINSNLDMNYITLKVGKQKRFNDYPNALDMICYTTDSSVANVNWDGTIHAVGKGSCYTLIWDYSTGRYKVLLTRVN